MRRDQAAAHRGQHHEVHHQFGTGNAQQLQGTTVRAVARGAHQRVVPRHQGDDQEDRTDIEQAHPPDHRVGRLDDLLRRVLRLGGSNGDDFGAEEGEHHPEHGHHHRLHAVGHEALRSEVAQAVDFTAGPEVDHRQPADHKETDNRHHLYQGEPELELAVVFDVEEVDADQHQGGGQHEHVDADRGEPAVQDLAGDVGFPGHQNHPEPPVQPADGEARPTADGTFGVGRERAGVGR
uniref:Uncharacterized protein n=1 Tax=Pseudomonas fluorescens TaxID=294 RepID=A0A5E6TE66_PSEFL|nr:hypothetical protein PS652_02688 [Pseudomonas fluorescens]